MLFETWKKYISMSAPATDAVQSLIGRSLRSVEEWAADYAVHLRQTLNACYRTALICDTTAMPSSQATEYIP